MNIMELKEAYMVMQEASGIEVGDTVKLALKKYLEG